MALCSLVQVLLDKTYVLENPAGFVTYKDLRD